MTSLGSFFFFFHLPLDIPDIRKNVQANWSNLCLLGMVSIHFPCLYSQ